MDENIYALIFNHMLKGESETLSKKILLALTVSTNGVVSHFPEEVDMTYVMRNTIYEKSFTLADSSYRLYCYANEMDSFCERCVVEWHTKDVSIVHCLLENIVSILINIITKDVANNIQTIHHAHIDGTLLPDALRDYNSIYELPDTSMYNYISGMFYEKNPCRGRMLFTFNKELIEDVIEIEFYEPISFCSKNYRMIRKYLEMVQEAGFLVVELPSYRITGIAHSMNKPCDMDHEHFVEFKGHMNWALWCGQNAIVEYINGSYCISEDAHQEANYHEVAHKMFREKGIDLEKYETFQNLIEYARKHSHGAMIIISNHANEEAERLYTCSRATYINPINLQENIELVSAMTIIDGAIIMDWNFCCYAIGAILDGPATQQGDKGRGARYNSAVTYVNWKKGESLVCAIVISEDRMTNIIY